HRLLHEDWDPQVGDQNDLAWRLIEHTQGYETLGITRGNSGKHGKSRSRTIRRGVTIRAALNDIAQVEDGFDWWIDENLEFHTQTPRRERSIDVGGGLRTLGWGQGCTEITRSGAADEYASRVVSIGARNETILPGGRVYPPPDPQVVRASDMPYGLWERAFSYPDVLTTATLRERAIWNLGEIASLRASYSCVFEPGLWNPNIQIGDLFELRIDSRPRTFIRELARIEELQIQVEPDGREVVTVQARVENTEIPTVVAPGAGPPDAVPGTPDEIVVKVPNGRSRPPRHIGGAAQFGALLADLSTRITRTERST
ncbi:MAG: hypothetical protein WBN50_12680, partial [Lutimonas sp.]